MLRLIVSFCAIAGAIGCGASAISAPSTATGSSVTPAAAAQPRRVGSPYAYEWFMRAEIWRAKRQLGPAIDAYQLALSSSDEDPHLLARYATALDEAGASGRADAALSDAFAQNPNSESAWLARGEIAQRRGDLSRALESYERAETVAPASPQPVLALAALLQKQGGSERARAVLARFEARVLPGTSGAQRARLRAAVLRGDAEAAYVEARAVGTPRPADVDELARAAELLLERDHCALALELLDALGKRPDQVQLRLRALLACAEFGAVEVLLRETDPELLGGVLEVARAYLSIGRAEDARELALGFRATHPEDLRAAVLVGEAQLGTGAAVEAAETFASVPLDAVGGRRAREGLARALEAAGQPELAREVLRTLPPSAATQ